MLVTNSRFPGYPQLPLNPFLGLTICKKGSQNQENTLVIFTHVFKKVQLRNNQTGDMLKEGMGEG
jgi:hypothetical protein